MGIKLDEKEHQVKKKNQMEKMLMEVMEGEDNEKRCQNQGLESKQTLGLLGKKK